MGTPATYPDGDAFQWDWEVNPSDPSSGLNPTESIFLTESIFPTETTRTGDHFFNQDVSSTAPWEHQYDLRPGEFTPTNYSFDLPSRDVDPSDAFNPTESIFPTETIVPADSFLPLEQGGVVHHDIYYGLMI
jgi:hypothetical protein